MVLVRKQTLDGEYTVPTGSVEVLWGSDDFCLDCVEGTLTIDPGTQKQIDAGNWQKTTHTGISLQDWVELNNHTAKLVAGVITHTDAELVVE